jgi:hypothetical protein
MATQLTDDAVKNSVEKLQRLARGAAALGFLTSATLMALELAIQRLAPATAQLQSPFEAACVLLWPSVILMLGAQTSHGGIVLFLLSACLNAGYFVFASMLFVATFDKVRSRAHVLAPVAVTRESTNHRGSERIRSSRSVA